MIYVLCICIVCASAFVGRIITNSIVMKDGFYKELLSMIMNFKNNISYLQTKTEGLFSSYMEKNNGKFKEQINLLKSISMGENVPVDKKTFYFLKRDEVEEIVSFFKDFGKLDEYGELRKLDVFSKIVEEKSKRVNEYRKKNEGLIYKVSIAAGVVVSILIV